MEPGQAEWERLPLIKVVGVSAAGKSTLVSALRERGYNARSASQEHSESPKMWRKIRPPVVLIYLEIDLATQRERRPDVTWDSAWLVTEEKRLAHARLHTDLILDTRGMRAVDVLELVQAWLNEHPLAHAAQPLPPLPKTGSAVAG